MWVPGTAAARLPVIAEMLDAAQASGDDDLVAQARLLRAAALLELGDPAGRDELLSYITLAGSLGHARGRWGALTRQATFAQLAGRAEEAARLGEQALELGLAIGEPDAAGCFCTSRLRWWPSACASRRSSMDASDPLWPMFPVLRAWPYAARGEAAAAAAALGDFSVLDITMWTGLEALAAAAVVFAVAGSDAQRSWVYERLRPYAGTHVVVGGCASYHAAVDHHLGALAASLGDTAAAEAHFRAALAMHERLGAAGWARLSEQALAGLLAAPASRAANEVRLVNGVRLLCYEGKQVQLPDSKGLGDIAALIGRARSRRARPHPGRAPPRPDGRRSGAGRDRPRRPTRRGWPAWPGRSRTPRPRAAPGEPRRCAPNATRSSASSPRPPGWAAGTASSAMRPNGPGRPSAPGSGTPWPRSGRYTPNWPITCAARCGWEPGVPIRPANPSPGK